jgi:NADH dehydrogenase FAD-containing subunit
MGQSSAETVKEIEQIRGRLEDEIKELEDRLPRPALWVKRLVGMAVGGGVAGFAFWSAVRRFQKRRQAQAEVEAERIEARSPVIQLVPERWAGRFEDAFADDRVKTLAGAAVAVWLLLRVAELRQLRRVNRALIAGR